MNQAAAASIWWAHRSAICGDLSPRARDLLRSVDVIACEDTRHSGQLLSSLGADGRKLSFISTTPAPACPNCWICWQKGKAVAVISDAGLPGISDPGEELVAAARCRPAIP